jgi:hypothetical protein
LSDHTECSLFGIGDLGLILKKYLIPPGHSHERVWKRHKLGLNKVKKRVAFILVFLCTTSLFFAFPPKAFSQTTSLNVLSYSWYTSPYSGNFIVVGELQNLGSETLGSAIITGTVYTKDGQAQTTDTYYSQIYAEMLLPNQTAPFYMEFSASTSNYGNLSWVSLGVDHVNFNLHGSAAGSEPYSGLYLVANTSYVDSSGNFSITGVLLNRGNGYPEKVWAVASFYDASGTVVAVGYSNFVTPPYLPPNQTAAFTLIPSDPTPQMATEITGYNLQILSKGSTTPPTPSPSSSPSASPAASSSSSPSATGSPSPGTSSTPEPGVYIPMSYVYAIVAAVIVAVAIIALAFILRKNTKAKALQRNEEEVKK